MLIEPYQYQKDAGNAAVKSLRTHHGAMVVMATGLGKTCTMWMIAEYMVKNGGSVLFLAHRDKLIEQAVASLTKFTGLSCGIEKAERTACRTADKIVVGSVQSMTQDRLDRYDPKRFTLILTDESHLSVADSYVRIYDRFHSAQRLGFTATAFRHDSKNLSDVYDTIAYEYPLRKAIADGKLCRIVSEQIKIDCDLSLLKSANGDFTAESAGSTIEPILGAIAEKMREKLASRHKSIAFLPLIKTSISAAEQFRDAGLRACHVAGESPDREQIVSAFELDSKNVLCNPMFLSVGYDHPPIDTVLWLRPTKSTLLYTQGVGRGTRLYPGKEYLYLPDLIGNLGAHDLCRPSSLYAETDEVEAAMNEVSQNAKAPLSLEETESLAHELLVDRREAKLAKQISENRTSKGKVDPVLGTLAVVSDAVSDWKPKFSDEAQSATPEQIHTLEKDGFDPTGWKKGYAETILNLVEQRRAQGLATPKQLRLMQRQHVKGAANLTVDQATAKIEGLKRKWSYCAAKRKG
jgi:superfamily II DNA or RNA helicase